MKNKLTLIEDLGMLRLKKSSSQKRHYGLYLCECGNVKVILTQSVKEGRTMSCGCYHSPSIKMRLKEKTIPITESGCLIWIGAVGKSGYGTIGHKGRTKKVHRLAYQEYKGVIPQGMHVLHKCDIPCCVNADHLFLGTNNDNIKDRNTKNRSAKGEKIATSKLTESKVREILKDNDIHQNIASKHGVTRSTISHIKRGSTWRHIRVNEL